MTLSNTQLKPSQIMQFLNYCKDKKLINTVQFIKNDKEGIDEASAGEIFSKAFR